MVSFDADGRYKVHSYDVFDTSLARMCARPIDVFYLAAREFLSESKHRLLHDWIVARRILAERVCVAKFGYGKYSLDDIYVRMPLWMGGLRRCELSIESKLLFSVRSVSDNIKEARSRNVRVCFISDMYLPTAFILEILESQGLYRVGDGIYVSSSVGHAKKDGELFHHVLREEGISANEMRHVGDSLISDVREPSTLGISAKLFLHSEGRKREQMTRVRLGGSIERSVLHGITKYTRLHLAGRGYPESMLNFTAGVVAPLLVCFVKWVMEGAKQMGLRRLYFVARDGQILLEIARVLNAGQYNFELEYLAVSRRTSFLAALNPTSSAELRKFLFPSFQRSSLGKVSEMLSIEFEVLKGGVENVLSGELTPSRVIRKCEVELVLNVLLRDPRLRKLIQQEVDASRRGLEGYLKSLSLVEFCDRAAFVDVGWEMNQQKALNHVLAGMGGSKVMPGFYIGGKAGRNFSVETGKGYFYYDETPFSGRISRRHIFYRMNLVEQVFTCADHGTTIGYKEFEGRHIPQFESEVISAARIRFVEINRNVCAVFARRYEQLYELLDPHAVNQSVAAIFSGFSRCPLSEELVFLTDWSVDHDQVGESSSPLIARYDTWSAIRSLARMDFIHYDKARCDWVEGSLSISRIHLVLKCLMRIKLSVRYLLITINAFRLSALRRMSS